MSDAELVKAILESKPIAYRSDFAKICGSVTAGVMLSQAYYWHDKSTKHKDGWFEKTGEEWHNETGLTEKQQQTARFILDKKGFMESARKGDRGRMCSRVKHTAVYEALFEYFKAADRQNGYSDNSVQIGKKDKLDRQNGHSKIGKKANLSLHRLPTETTAEREEPANATAFTNPRTFEHKNTPKKSKVISDQECNHILNIMREHDKGFNRTQEIIKLITHSIKHNGFEETEKAVKGRLMVKKGKDKSWRWLFVGNSDYLDALAAYDKENAADEDMRKRWSPEPTQITSEELSELESRLAEI